MHCFHYIIILMWKHLKKLVQRKKRWAKKYGMPNLSRIHPGLELKVSPQARRMALRLDTQRRVMYLVVPSHTRTEKAYDFALQYRDWIKENLSALPAPIPFEDGAIIPVFGKKVRISVAYDPDLNKTDISLDRNILHVFTNKEYPSRRIERFLRELAFEKIEQIAYRKAACIGEGIKSVNVRDTKTRWGSCNHRNEISYSWRLIFAPRQAMDYVIAHEVAHLAHFDHSDEFWAMCCRLSASYRKGREWMDEHGHTLWRFGQGEE